MRLFVGVYPPEEIIDYIYDIENSLISKGVSGNYTKKENIHLTLKFLGETEDSKIDPIKNILNEYRNLDLNLEINKLSYFKRGSEAILWLGLSGDIDKLEGYANNLNNQLYELEFEREYKKFKPHITMARKVNFNDLNLRLISSIPIKNLNFKIQNINLIQSTLTKQGPIYKTLY